MGHHLGLKGSILFSFFNCFLRREEMQWLIWFQTLLSRRCNMWSIHTYVSIFVQEWIFQVSMSRQISLISIQVTVRGKTLIRESWNGTTIDDQSRRYLWETEQNQKMMKHDMSLRASMEMMILRNLRSEFDRSDSRFSLRPRQIQQRHCNRSYFWETWNRISTQMSRFSHTSSYWETFSTCLCTDEIAQEWLRFE